jgi:hypothetical protein
MAKKKPAESDGDIESRIRPVSEVPDHKKILVYGSSGTGKTTFVATCPRPILVLDPGEKGTSSIRKQADVDYLPLNSWEDLEAAYWYLDSKGHEKYKTVCIDTATRLQDLAMSHVNPDDGPMAKNKWGELSSLMKSWLVLFRDLPMHVVFCAQDRETETDMEDEGTILPEVGAAVMPSVAKTLNAAVDIIGNTFVREFEKTVIDPKTKATKTKTVAEYCMRLGPHARYRTKIRVDGGGPIPRFISSPTFQKIVNLQNGEE